MSKHTRKLVAAFLLLWLPLFGASAVAESLAMQLRHGDCHEPSAPAPMAHHEMMDMADHHAMQHDMTMQTAADDDASSCTSCGICHIACSAFLAPDFATHSAANGSEAVPGMPVRFVSHLSAPLDPPPLVRA